MCYFLTLLRIFMRNDVFLWIECVEGTFRRFSRCLTEPMCFLFYFTFEKTAASMKCSTMLLKSSAHFLRALLGKPFLPLSLFSSPPIFSYITSLGDCTCTLFSIHIFSTKLRAPDKAVEAVVTALLTSAQRTKAAIALLSGEEDGEDNA